MPSPSGAARHASQASSLFARQTRPAALTVTAPPFKRSARASSSAAGVGGPRALQDGPHDAFNAITQRLQHEHQSSPSNSPSPISGWTVGIKENICVKGAYTTCASRMLQDFKSPFDATAVQLLRNAGAAIVAKTNCDEFGMGSENTFSVHGAVRNPAKHQGSTDPTGATWVPEEERVAGGSSGGSAAAVRAGLVRIAIGSDTGGSIRLPAAYCGVVGLKPSYGLVSRWGLVSYADSLDTVGVLGSSTADVASALHVLSQPDESDATCVDAAVRLDAAALSSCTLPADDGIQGLRIGIAAEFFPSELNPRVLPSFREAVRRLRSLGATIVPVRLPSLPLSLSAYYTISSAEASSNLARYDGIEYGVADRTVLGPEVQRRILLGTYVLSADAYDSLFLAAERVRAAVSDELDALFVTPSAARVGARVRTETEDRQGGVHVLLHPSAVDTAPTLAQAARSNNPYVQDVLTVPASLAGLPAASFPAGTADDGWPVGVTATAQWGCEAHLLRVGEALEL